MRRSLFSRRSAIARRGRRAIRNLLAFCACAGGAATPFASAAFAQSADDAVPAIECCGSLLYPVGARTVALGQALTARAGEDGVFINPAALTKLEDEEIVVHRSTIGEDPMTTVSLLIHSRVAGVFGLTYRFIDYGKSDAVDDVGNVTGQLGTIDQVLIASFATTLAKGWSAGVNYRLYNFAINCDGFCQGDERSGTTHMVDAGVTFTPAFLTNLVLGAALLNAGPKLQINNAFQADFTPTRFRVGGAYDLSRIVTTDTTTAIWLHVDAVGRLHDAGPPGINAGVEVSLDQTIFFRAGHASEAGGISFGGNAVGLGLKYERFDINVAKSVTPSPLFEEPFYITVGVSF